MNNSILSIEGALTGTTNQVQSEPHCKESEEERHTFLNMLGCRDFIS